MKEHYSMRICMAKEPITIETLMFTRENGNLVLEFVEKNLFEKEGKQEKWLGHSLLHKNRKALRWSVTV